MSVQNGIMGVLVFWVFFGFFAFRRSGGGFFSLHLWLMCFDFGTEAFHFGCILFLGLSSEQITSRSRFAKHKVSKLQKLSCVLSDQGIYTDSLVCVKGFDLVHPFLGLSLSSPRYDF